MACPFLPDEVPVLRAGDIVLREMRPRDATAWFRCLSDPQVTRLTNWDIRSIDDVRDAIANTSELFAQKETFRWAVTAGRGRPFVGTCGFLRFDEHDGRGEIGYELAPPNWGRGIMSAALRLVLEYMFDTLGLHRIEATVMVGNQRSANLLVRRRFAREGTLRGYRNARGSRRDTRIYGLLRSEWRPAIDPSILLRPL